MITAELVKMVIADKQQYGIVPSGSILADAEQIVQREWVANRSLGRGFLKLSL